jgi:hypothetical protein
MRRGLLTTYIIALSIITWDEVKNFQRVPQPKRYLYATLVWAVLGFLADMGLDSIAVLFGVGLVLSMAYSQYANGNPLVAPNENRLPSDVNQNQQPETRRPATA